MSQTVVAAFYQFAPFDDCAAIRDALAGVCAQAQTTGTILVAPEGVNGTIAGSREGVDLVLNALRALPGCNGLEHKESFADTPPFLRMKVRLKQEIVTLGAGPLDPAANAGTYVEPQDWNALLDDPDLVLIDTRNDYEVAIGSFDGAINPQTASFRDFPAWFKRFRETNIRAKIAMFCTGGIRCEKATALARLEGCEEVFHLRGGILKYLETVPQAESRFSGECFVFDQRVSVQHGLVAGSHGLCHGCRRPVSAEDQADPRFIEGVACPHCHDETDPGQRARFAERQRQIELAQRRGAAHLGPKAVAPDPA